MKYGSRGDRKVSSEAGSHSSGETMGTEEYISYKKPQSILQRGLETNRLELKCEHHTAIKVHIIPSPP